MESLQSRHADSSLQDRVVTTLRIADRWGYGLAGEEVSSLLYGGPESGADVSSTLVGSASVIFRDGIAALRGREDLIEKCLARRRSNGALAGTYFRIADDFARDLLRHSPFVRAIAVCGSTASGGIEAGDDVDFNLFAEDGTKYIVYLTALLLGVKSALVHGRGFAKGRFFFRLFPKVTCVNVVWTDSDCRSFIRQDEFLAFELLRSIPIAGTGYFARTLLSNPWLQIHFPQIFTRVFADRVRSPRPSLVARIQRWVARTSRGRQLLDSASREVASVLHRVVRLTRERDPEAVERQAFLRRVKFPYDVFQD